ncbi:MAG: Neutral ceramidase [Paenibacillus sp.]|nr:Neutral ceramidase [Paenibacillus sp.]
MKIGLAEVNITPPLGMQIPGYGPKPRLATGMKDELYAKAMVIESGETALAFIVIDIISLELDSSERIRDRVHEYTGIPPEHVMVSCTHTHTGPPRPVDADALGYYPTLEAKSADAAILAWSKREEARIGYGRGSEDSVAFNRRFFMKDGTLQTNPGILNPDIDRPEGPIDPEVLVVRIDNALGEPLGVVSNYAVHTDCVSGTEYSGDYPAYISRTIKQLYGESVVSLFFQGACGNINHIDVLGRHDPKVIPHRIRMGNILGLEISKVRDKTKAAEGNAGLAVASRFVNVSERALRKHEIEWAENTLAALRGIPDDTLSSKQVMEKTRAKQRLDSIRQPLTSRKYEIQVSAIGDLAVVALPAEMFVEFGLEIKEKSPYAYTMINELSNGSGNNYVCTPAAYDRGGYEPTGTKFAEEAGDLFVRAALELLNELHRRTL